MAAPWGYSAAKLARSSKGFRQRLRKQKLRGKSKRRTFHKSESNIHWALDLHAAGRYKPGINHPKIPAEFQKRFVQGKENNPKETQGLAQPDPTTGLAGSHGWF